MTAAENAIRAINAIKRLVMLFVAEKLQAERAAEKLAKPSEAPAPPVDAD